MIFEEYVWERKLGRQQNRKELGIFLPKSLLTESDLWSLLKIIKAWFVLSTSAFGLGRWLFDQL